MSEYGVSRRNLICGFVAAGATVPLIAACGSSTSDTGGSGGSAAGTGNGGSSGGSGGSSNGGSGGGSGGGSTVNGSIQASEIPVGGGKIFPDAGFVITQPTAGNFKAFSSSCTHQGTTLNQIAHGDIICPLHGSQFSIKDGSVDQGPASFPLPAKTVTLDAAKGTLTVSG